MTIAMFSLIVFSLVMMATITENFLNLFLGDEANAGWDVRADALSANPINDFEATLRANGIDTSGFIATASVTTIRTSLHRPGCAGGEWKNLPVRGMDQDFITDEQAQVPATGRGLRDGRRHHSRIADANRMWQ